RRGRAPDGRGARASGRCRRDGRRRRRRRRRGGPPRARGVPRACVQRGHRGLRAAARDDGGAVGSHARRAPDRHVRCRAGAPVHATPVSPRAVLPDMTAARWGRVVTLSSVGALRGGPNLAHYAAAKAGVIGFTKALALEVGCHGITANAIAPGLVDTPMLRGSGIPPDVLEQSLRQVPLGRLGTPEDVAAVCAFLVSEEAGFVTGQVVSPNGGGWV